MDRFWGECDKGYTLVKELVENDAFKSLVFDNLVSIKFVAASCYDVVCK